MKTFLIRTAGAAVVTTGFLFSAALVSSAGVNLVQNGDLETPSATPTIPQGWASDYWGTLTPVFTYPVAGKGGGKAVQTQITKYTSGDAKWYFTHIPTTPGTVYTFSDDYLATIPTNVTIEYLGTNGSYSYIWLADLPATAGAWATYTQQFTVPTGVKSFTIYHVIQSVGVLTLDNFSVTNGTTTPPPVVPPAPTSTPPVVPPVVIAKPTINSFIATPVSILVGSSTTLTWNVVGASSTSIDQGVGVVTGTSKTLSPTVTTTYTLTATNPGGATTASVVVTVTTPPPPPPPPPPAGNNLINNGNLEAGSGATPTGWQSDYWGSMRPTFTYPVAGNGGGKAAKVTVTNWRSGDAKWWFNHIPVSSNTVYRFTEDYTATVISNVSIEFLMSNGSYQYQWVANEPVASIWTPLTVEVTVPTGAVSMSVLHALDKNGTLTIDNASLVALPANPFPQGMVTIVFDDGLVSQYTNTRSILAAAGFKAMFAIITQGVRDFSGDTASMTWAQITQLKNDGHEIGGHSRTHPDLSLMTSAQAQTEIKGSYDDLVAKGFVPKTFVYPLGGVSPAVETIVKNAGYIGARGSYWGLNSPTADKFALYDMRLDKTTTLTDAKAWIDQAYADKRWLTLELHDVLGSGGDDYAITTAFFQSVVTYMKQKGIKVVTLQEGLQYMQ